MGPRGPRAPRAPWAPGGAHGAPWGPYGADSGPQRPTRAPWAPYGADSWPEGATWAPWAPYGADSGPQWGPQVLVTLRRGLRRFFRPQIWILGSKMVPNKVEIEGAGPPWRDPDRKNTQNPGPDVKNGGMATHLVTKRFDLGSFGVPGPARTPLGQPLGLPRGPRADFLRTLRAKS